MEEKLGDRIRKTREGCGMSAKFLAGKAEITRQQLYMIENNKTPDPGVLTIQAIADVLRVSVDALLGREPKKSEMIPAAVA